MLLQGPAGDPTYPGGRYATSVGFEVKWQREAEAAPPWHWPAKETKGLKHRSRPLTVPKTTDMTLTVTLTETGDMEQFLEDLADKVQKARLD